VNHIVTGTLDFARGGLNFHHLEGSDVGHAVG
jgi:hypothetical protein